MPSGPDLDEGSADWGEATDEDAGERTAPAPVVSDPSSVRFGDATVGLPSLGGPVERTERWVAPDPSLTGEDATAPLPPVDAEDLRETIALHEPLGETLLASIDARPRSAPVPTPDPRARSVARLELDTLPSHVRAAVGELERELGTTDPGAGARPMLGPYLLLGRLGSGDEIPPELENVLEVRQVATPRRCVLRRQAEADRARGGRCQERFLAEARAARLVDHPHVVRVHEVGVEDGRAHLVREFVSGMNAYGLAVDGPAPLEAVLAVGAQVASGLDHVHAETDLHGGALHLVHAALSPSAILIGVDGRARVTEPAFARSSGRALDARKEARLGREGYLAPEQARGDPLTPQVDVFALGLVLAELLSGRPQAWDGRTGAATLGEALGAGLAARGDVPEALVELLAQMVSARPVDRPVPAEIAHRLDGLLAERVPGVDPGSVLANAVARARTASVEAEAGQGWVSSASLMGEALAPRRESELLRPVPVVRAAPAEATEPDPKSMVTEARVGAASDPEPLLEGRPESPAPVPSPSRREQAPSPSPSRREAAPARPPPSRAPDARIDSDQSIVPARPPPLRSAARRGARRRGPSEHVLWLALSVGAVVVVVLLLLVLRAC